MPVGAMRRQVYVSQALPRRRRPKPPPFRLKEGEDALHLILRAGADPTATAERKPVPSVEAQPHGREE